MRVLRLKFNFAKINSLTKVIQTLEQLEDRLIETKLANLKAFNKAYLVITKNIYKKVQQNHFSHPQTLMKLDIEFADYYFKALQDYLKGKKIPIAWQIMFDSCIENNLPQIIYLTLGANAHINTDLADSLLNTVDNLAFKSDYQKVQQVIDLSIKELGLSWPASVIAKILLDRWRAKAWENYRKLQTNQTTQDDLVKKAGENAKTILLFSKIML